MWGKIRGDKWEGPLFILHSDWLYLQGIRSLRKAFLGLPIIFQGLYRGYYPFCFCFRGSYPFVWGLFIGSSHVLDVFVEGPRSETSWHPFCPGESWEPK